MEIAVDSNIVFSAMISDSTTRETLLDSGHKFYSPEFIQLEITKHQDLITEKSGLTDQEFEMLLNLILDEIEIQPKEEYKHELKEPEEILGDQDIKRRSLPGSSPV
jgi:predicted nucleic acid-binding protein